MNRRLLDLDREELILRELEAIDSARETLRAFTLYTKPDYIFNWHHEIIIRALERLLAGIITRLVISAPPRHGKSELVSRRFPSFALGKNPDLQVISTSYAASLASRMNRDVQRIIDSDRYRLLFPDTRLGGDNVRNDARGGWLRNSNLFEIVGRRGIYQSAGVGGPITGTGGDLIIVDDPVKNWKEAKSKVIRKAIWEWYTSTLWSRLEDSKKDGREGKLLICMTRWDEEDLAGMVLDKAKKDEGAEQWEHINLESIAETPSDYDPREMGEPLWPEKMSLKRLERARAQDPRVFSALFQGKPSPEGGKIFDPKGWKYYQVLPKKFDRMIQSWDFSFEEGDANSFVVGQVWGKVGPYAYLIHQFRKQVGYTDSKKAIIMVSEMFPKAFKKIVEKKANGHAILNALKGKIPGLTPKTPDGSKPARASTVSDLTNGGFVWLPHSSIAPWIVGFVDEHSRFPGDFDDQVDGTTQALEEPFGKNTDRLKNLLGDDFSA